MEKLPHFEEVLSLGRELVNELGNESTRDTLSHWMAHYIAELIDLATNASASQRAVCQDRCFNAILSLWSRRTELVDGKRPFRDLELIGRAVESLDPASSRPRYFQFIGDEIVDGDESSRTRSLLEFVTDLDRTTRILIGHFLAEAAKASIDRSREWVVLADKAGAEVAAERMVIRFVAGDVDRQQNTESKERERELLEHWIQQLGDFSAMVTGISDDLKVRLEILSSADPTSAQACDD